MNENQSRFQQLIELAESETLDFKADGYDLQSPRGKGDFIKDVLAMANTPREQSAHIIFGVRWTPESGSTVVGLKDQLDDAQLQDLLGPKRVQPNPRFIYTPLEFDGKQVGILEIPVGTGGPYTPIHDSDELGLQAAVYYRRGTENQRATGSTQKDIYDWWINGNNFVPEDPGEDSWRRFFDAMHHFEQGRTYILAVDRISSHKGEQIHALGMPPWRAVIDFDPESDVSGFLSCIKDTLQSHRVIHRTVRSDYRVQPEPGTHWFFAQGLSGRQETLVSGSHKAWLGTYKRELGQQLTCVASAISPSPVVALVFWSDTNLKKHLRTLIEELHGAFGNAIDIVVVSNDEPSFSGLAEEEEDTYAFIRMNLRSLCASLAGYYADLQNTTEERYVLPLSSGAPVEVNLDDWLWLSEDLELLHRSIGGIAGDDDPREYRLGADITWRNLHLRHDCDRDITPELRRQVEDDLRRRRTVRINLYHEPGGGGTTVGHRLAWELHNTFPVGILRECRPRETVEKISRVAALTASSVLVIVDGGQHAEQDTDELYELLKANQTPTVLVQVLRRFYPPRSDQQTFWLPAELTDLEADRFRNAYAQAVLEKRMDLAALARQPHNRNAFFFGLTAFGRDFRGLPRYVEDRIGGLTEEQRRILVYISIAHYYGQQSIPTQAFTSLLQIPSSKTIDLTAAFTGDARPTLDLLTENQQGKWRTTHHLIAQEIMQQVLAPEGSQSPEEVWRQNLSSWGKDFASFCRGDQPTTSDRSLELVRRVFIYRDNFEVLGTERAGQSQFSQLIEQIPSPHGRREVLRHLIDEFPLEAHFHAHLGRFLGLNGEHDEALECVNSAISLQPEDHVLHHMRGMVLRQEMKADTGAENLIDRLIGITEEASESFEEARRLGPDREHGYISEVQMLIDLIDRIGQRRHGVIPNILARWDTDPFLQQALERAEELLDRVRHLHAGEELSQYAVRCQARLEIIYDNYPRALQAWDNLLSRPEVAKPPVRRQIVWTTLRRRDGDWGRLTDRETERMRRLLEENLEEEVNDSTSLRLWLRAIRQSQLPPSLDSVIEKVGYWKVNTNALDAAYYLYVLHTLHALNGSLQGAADAERALEECRSRAQFRRDRTRSFEWIGPGNGVRALVHQSRLGEWQREENFWESADALARLQGRIKDIGGPQKGLIELDSGIEAFFVPGRSGFNSGRDENALVNFYLGFSYDGPRAWDIQRAER